MAGADVKAFFRLDREASVVAVINRVQSVFSRLEALPLPTLLHGHCLGGGLELALACRYRLACADESTRLGFPEIRLGIFPGFGGSVRSTRLLGPSTALRMMLDGRSITGSKAKTIGLVDQLVPRRQLKAAALGMILRPPPVRLAALPAGRCPVRSYALCMPGFCDDGSAGV